FYPNADFRTRLYELPPGSKIKRFRLWFSQFGSGASVLLSLIKGYNAIGIGTGNDILNKTVSFANLGAIQYYEFNQEITDLSAFYMNFRFNHASISDTAAIIQRAEIDWESPNIYAKP
ncbi:MAG: hypothetical protein ACREQO_11230, partial [Candidatus Binatia bacterium]